MTLDEWIKAELERIERFRQWVEAERKLYPEQWTEHTEPALWDEAYMMFDDQS